MAPRRPSGSSIATRPSSAPSPSPLPGTWSSSPARGTSAIRSSRTAGRCPSMTSPSPARPCVRAWSPEQVAQAAGGRLVAAGPQAGGPLRAVIDSRAAGPGDLFVGLVGENVDGGRFAAQALDGGAWGVLVAPAHADGAAVAGSGAAIA